MMTILDMIRDQKLTVTEVAKRCNVAVSQIYTWNRQGISRHNPHFDTLQKLLPGVQPKEILLKQNGEEDGRYKSGRKKKKLKLSDTDTSFKHTEEITSTLFPTITIKKKAAN